MFGLFTFGNQLFFEQHFIIWLLNFMELVLLTRTIIHFCSVFLCFKL